LEVGITYNRMLCNDFTGPARFRLNMPEVALELKRVWHPWCRGYKQWYSRDLTSRPRPNLVKISRPRLHQKIRCWKFETETWKFVDYAEFFLKTFKNMTSPPWSWKFSNFWHFSYLLLVVSYLRIQ